VHGVPSIVAPSIFRELLKNVKNLTIFAGAHLGPWVEIQKNKKDVWAFFRPKPSKNFMQHSDDS